MLGEVATLGTAELLREGAKLAEGVTVAGVALLTDAAEFTRLLADCTLLAVAGLLVAEDGPLIDAEEGTGVAGVALLTGVAEPVELTKLLTDEIELAVDPADEASAEFEDSGDVDGADTAAAELADGLEFKEELALVGGAELIGAADAGFELIGG